MRLGVVFPQTEIGADRGAVKAYVEAVRDLGFDHLLAYDHVLGADPTHYSGYDDRYNSNSQFHEVMVLFGFVAALAPRLELVNGVVILPQRQTALVAKQAAEIDILTSGNYRLGVGIGWNPVEYEALGMNFLNRAKRFEEQIDLMRKLWTTPVLSDAGRYHTITCAGINPLPVQRPIPIWIGASAEPAIKRAATVADGFFPQRPLDGGWQVTLDKLRGWLREAGRDEQRFGIDQRINAGTGSADDWRAVAEEWRGLGATHLSINTMGGGLRGADAHIDRLRQAHQALDQR
jgi:probable F420-dependent oxidoreductase